MLRLRTPPAVTRFVWWAAFSTWIALAPWLLLRPLEGGSTFGWVLALDVPRVDLLGHAFLFWLGARTALSAVATAREPGGLGWRTRLGVVGVVALYAAVLEGLQFFVPGRALQVSDLVANTTGAALAAWGLARRSSIGWSAPAASAVSAAAIVRTER
jgi:hypothetical protein